MSNLTMQIKSQEVESLIFSRSGASTAGTHYVPSAHLGAHLHAIMTHSCYVAYLPLSFGGRQGIDTPRGAQHWW